MLSSFFLQRKIKKMSLRARVGLCIACLEVAMEGLDCREKILKKLLNRLREFIIIDNENSQLFQWQEDLLNDRGEIGQFLESFDSSGRQKDTDKFPAIPDRISKLIWYTIEVITGSFAGTTKDYINNATKEATFKAYKIIKDDFENDLDISVFLESRYDEDFRKYHGFGKPLKQSFFQKRK